MVVCFCVELWFLSGVRFLFGTMSPSRPDPCLFVYLRRPLLFCSVGFVDAVFSLLFLFLSGAGETQALSGVWGSPCVSSPWTSSPTSIRTSSSSPTPRLCPAPVFSFFFSSSSLVCRLGVFSFLVLSVSVFMVGVFCPRPLSLSVRCIA